MTDATPPREPDFPKDPRVTPPLEGDERKWTSGGVTREELEVSDVGLRALASAGRDPLSLAGELGLFEGLGCPPEEVRKIVGKGYLAEYQRHLSQMPQRAAEALVCLMISQDPDIGVDLRKKISPQVSEGGTGGSIF
jgi:hypothetical protein